MIGRQQLLVTFIATSVLSLVDDFIPLLRVQLGSLQGYFAFSLTLYNAVDFLKIEIVLNSIAHDILSLFHLCLVDS